MEQYKIINAELITKIQEMKVHIAAYQKELVESRRLVMEEHRKRIEAEQTVVGRIGLIGKMCLRAVKEINSSADIATLFGEEAENECDHGNANEVMENLPNIERTRRRTSDGILAGFRRSNVYRATQPVSSPPRRSCRSVNDSNSSSASIVEKEEDTNSPNIVEEDEEEQEEEEEEEEQQSSTQTALDMRSMLDDLEEEEEEEEVEEESEEAEEELEEVEEEEKTDETDSTSESESESESEWEISDYDPQPQKSVITRRQPLRNVTNERLPIPLSSRKPAAITLPSPKPTPPPRKKHGQDAVKRDRCNNNSNSIQAPRFAKSLQQDDETLIAPTITLDKTEESGITVESTMISETHLRLSELLSFNVAAGQSSTPNSTKEKSEQPQKVKKSDNLLSSKATKSDTDYNRVTCTPSRRCSNNDTDAEISSSRPRRRCVPQSFMEPSLICKLRNDNGVLVVNPSRKNSHNNSVNERGKRSRN